MATPPGENRMSFLVRVACGPGMAQKIYWRPSPSRPAIVCGAEVSASEASVLSLPCVTARSGPATLRLHLKRSKFAAASHSLRLSAVAMSSASPRAPSPPSTGKQRKNIEHANHEFERREEIHVWTGVSSRMPSQMVVRGPQDGALFTWGDGASGALGYEHPSRQYIPRQVGGGLFLEAVTQVRRPSLTLIPKL